MSDQIASLRDQWNALKLEILIPAKLTDEQLGIILAARTASRPPQDFREMLPLTVAHFKHSAKIGLWHRSWQANRYAGMGSWKKAWGRDIQKINMVFFNDPGPFILSGEAGYYDERKASNLHADKLGDTGFAYMARLFGLPIEAIKGSRLAQAAPEERDLIEEGKHESEADDVSLQELRKRKIVNPIPLGDVVLALQCGKEEEGSLHCSSPLPKRRVRSAFFRALSYGRFQSAA